MNPQALPYDSLQIRHPLRLRKSDRVRDLALGALLVDLSTQLFATRQLKTKRKKKKGEKGRDAP